MRPRFLVLLRDRTGAPPDGPVLAADLGLTLTDDRPGLLVLIGGDCRSYRIGDAQVVGTLFPRFGPAVPIESGVIESAESARPSAEDRLLARYWGGYVAFLPAQRSVRVLRDPSGVLPCYFAETSGGFVLASDIDLLLAAGLAPPDIGWAAVTRFFYLRGLPTPETCLEGIEELLPGYALDVSGVVVDQRMRWSPWDHVTGGNEPAGLPVQDQLRRTAQHSVEALTRDYDRLLVSVSGGLDSSIVAACLARAGRDAHCVTMFTDDPAGDERVYARALCQHLGLPLFERPYRVEAVEIDVAISPHLPRPIGRTVTQAYDKVHVALADELQIDAFVTGNGGDNVFGFSQSAAAIVDHYLYGGVTPALIRTIRDVCRQTETGPAAVLRAALRSGRRGYRWTPGPMFLDPDMVAAVTPRHFHQPWLDAPAGTGPGKGAHVAALLRVQQLLEPARSDVAPVITPLISQPMLEACLGIPSWLWREGGRDRAVARDAFSADLPAVILRRRAKGGPDGFAAAVMNRHRTPIRDRLLEGALTRHHVTDRAALEARFRNGQPFSAEELVRLFDLLDTEAWVSAWQRRAGAASRRTANAASAPGPPSV